MLGLLLALIDKGTVRQADRPWMETRPSLVRRSSFGRRPYRYFVLSVEIGQVGWTLSCSQRARQADIYGLAIPRRVLHLPTPRQSCLDLEPTRTIWLRPESLVELHPCDGGCAIRVKCNRLASLCHPKKRGV